MVGKADELPFPNAHFTCAVMTGVLYFLPRPLATFREIYRTLRPGGWLAVYSGTMKQKGTPASPYPIADRLRFYEDRELRSLAREAGFERVTISHPSLARYAKAAGLPPSVVRVFRSGAGNVLLWARKPVAASPPRRRAT